MFRLLWATAISLAIGIVITRSAIGDHGSRAESLETAAVALPDLTSADWVTLFNGEDLSGWVQRNGTAIFEAIDGEIVGKTVVGSPDSFLCTEKEFTDFELTFEVKLDKALNSGVQIRSASKKEINQGKVYGPQIEVEAVTEDPSNPCEAGYIFSQGTGRGWLSQDRVIRDAFKNDQWNRFIVRAVGARIQIWINGRKVEDLFDEPSSRKGFIALQVHSIPNDTGPFQVHWRDLRIRELAADSR